MPRIVAAAATRNNPLFISTHEPHVTENAECNPLFIYVEMDVSG